MGEVRQSPLAVKVNPAGGGATEQEATLTADRIRQIEYESNGTQATLTALENAVERSYGVFGLTVDYAAWDSDELRIKYRRFPNPDAVSWDPDCKEADWSDMTDAFVHDWITFDAFRERFGPDATPTMWATDQATAPEWINVNEQQVQVSEYLVIEKTERVCYFLSDGRKFFEDELPEGYQISQIPDGNGA